MYCPVEIISPFLTFDINGMHRKQQFLYHPQYCIQQYHYISLRCVFVQCHKGTWEKVDQHHS